MSKSAVTEQDFRMPEFRDAKPDDYERRDDGAIVRKDRWETGLRNVATAIGWCRREYEIPEVVDAVQELVEPAEAFKKLEELMQEHGGDSDAGINIRFFGDAGLYAITLGEETYQTRTLAEAINLAAGDE